MVLLDITIAQLLADPMMYVISFLLGVGTLILIFRELQKNTLIVREKPSAKELIDKLEDIGFFNEIDRVEYKLASYRLLRRTYTIIRETLQQLNKDLTLEHRSILNKDLQTLLLDTEELLYHPAIAQMLHDTEELKIQKPAKDKLSNLKRRYHNILLKYDKTLLSRETFFAMQS